MNKQSKQFRKWEKSLCKLEEKINYSFKDKKNLQNALIHSSSTPKTYPKKSETLEFLGDSVLELIITEYLFQKFPDENEGKLSKTRSKIVSKKYLNWKAKEIGLSNFIFFNGNTKLKKDAKNVLSVNADAMESLIAAIFLDSSYLEAKYVVSNLILSNWEKILGEDGLKNYKSFLQEWAQSKFRINPKYEIVKESGLSHRKKFYVQLNVANKYKSKGNGNSKKSAEQNAAKNLIKKFKLNEK
ncbi:MAG: ribonuclease III [Candidatus Cloacimonetes bacterium]|nr:ribonuclease III [Candidatus Cloacimonadota bacterium]